MSIVELLHKSLIFAFDVLNHVVSDLTQEQADWLPPGKSNPISAHYWHIISYIDQLVHDWGMPPYQDISLKDWAEKKSARQDTGIGQPSIRHSAGWQEKVVLKQLPKKLEDPYWDVRAGREGLQVDLPALHEYAKIVQVTLLKWVCSLDEADLERTMPTPIGDFNIAEMIEIFVISHINNHVGEIAALKGCQGLMGYPW